VTQSSELEPDLTGVDIVHLFNLIGGWTLSQFRHARRHGMPIALSTIYNPRQFAMTSYVEQLEMVRDASVLLPNSRAEEAKLAADFGRTAPVAIVPNGIEPRELPSPDAAPFAERDIALFVGRIDERKRALELVCAWMDPRIAGRIPLVICGHPFLPPYFEQVRAAAASAPQGAIRFEGEVPSARLPEYYRRARVFVLPSRLETPGLANLEAAASGCALVAGDCPDVREYFAELARYCDGADVRSIADAVVAAWESPPRPELAELVRSRYTWDAAARATLEAYRAALTVAPANA
jgi:glycosyltransferase involved in cell wall biosynthesis